MKSVENICCKEKKELTFPRLMRGINTGSIYLITKVVNHRYHLVVVKRGDENSWPLGFTTDIMGTALEDYDGTITLSND